MMAWLLFVLKMLGVLAAGLFCVVVAVVIVFCLWVLYEQAHGRNPFL